MTKRMNLNVRPLLPRPHAAKGHAERAEIDQVESHHDWIAKLGIHNLTIRQAKELANMLGHDGSCLSIEQRQALYKLYFVHYIAHCAGRTIDEFGYYEELSQPISVAEGEWPADVALRKAVQVCRGYIDPVELTNRLYALKPSLNFEFRPVRQPNLDWQKSPIHVRPIFLTTPRPGWMTEHEQQLGQMRHLTALEVRAIVDELNARWKFILHQAATYPPPARHLLRDMSASPGGTLFPRHLIRGLAGLLSAASRRGKEQYEEEYEAAEALKEDAADRWQQENPETVLDYDPVSILRVWPEELQRELMNIDLAAVCRGRNNYYKILCKTARKMQRLVNFWRGCGGITGIRSPPDQWWLVPWNRDQSLWQAPNWPPKLAATLAAIRHQYGFQGGLKLRLIEIARWREAYFRARTEPFAAQFPLSLQAQLEMVWIESRWQPKTAERRMIRRIGYWAMFQSHKAAAELPCGDGAPPRDLPAAGDVPMANTAQDPIVATPWVSVSHSSPNDSSAAADPPPDMMVWLPFDQDGTTQGLPSTPPTGEDSGVTRHHGMS